jgi:shikimate kinase
MTAKPSPKSGHRHLVLIGYRGSGKTSVGKNLAKILGLDYLDTDIAIQEKSGRSVKEIFADHGEAAFRDMETEILEELVSHQGTAQPTVIATGGGMVMREHNRRLLKQLGTVIWLQVSAKTALDRILGDSFTGEQRPALTDQNLADEVRVMVSDRLGGFGPSPQRGEDGRGALSGTVLPPNAPSPALPRAHPRLCSPSCDCPSACLPPHPANPILL